MRKLVEIEVEVIYALPWNQVSRHLKVPFGTSAKQAVQLSGIRKTFPEIDLLHNSLGIFGKLVKPETILRNYDRVEIYRPLTVDPKEKRRNRAETITSIKRKNK